MARLFVALEIPESERARLEAVERAVSGARWVRGPLHLTLSFVEDGDPERVAAALEAVGGAPFDLRLERGGRFPPSGEPRVLWVGVSPGEPVVALAHGVARALEGAGVPREARAFHPHVTLARLKRPRASQVEAYIAALDAVRSPAFPVERFVLFESRLEPTGAVHTARSYHPL